MTLEEFMEELRRDVDNFAEHNLKMQVHDPEWPRDLEAGDWFEQFLMFIENS